MSYSGPSSADNFLKQLYESTGSAHSEPKAMYTGDISEECRCLHIRKLSMLGAAVFSGVAGCITLMEQPALMKLDNANALKSWKFMYRRGAPLQAGLVVVSGAIGAMTAYKTRDLAWIVGTGLMLANMPFTLLFILPTNKRLMATEEKRANASTRADLEHWGKLHAVRTGLGIAATFAFLYGLIRTG